MNDNKSNYTDNYMIDFNHALELIANHSTLLGSEVVKLNQAKGRILSEQILSPVAIPPFNNSAMDGYAVNHQDLSDASSENPVELKLAGLTAAGDPPSSLDESKGTAWKIMTGAPVPNGYDSIIPVENTQLNDTIVSCFSQPNVSAHIRLRGEDFVEDQLVLKENLVINSNRIMALASLGIAQVKVRTKPKIAVFSTGKELIDDLNQPLESGQIYNSNMPYIVEFLNQLPVDVYNAGTNYDDVDAYQKALQIELDKGANIIISTGAVSMGDFDFIPQTIKKMGGEIIFHKSRIRPGKPILFARFANGCFYFGLPGNPISASIGLRFFVTRLLTSMLGVKAEEPTKGLLNATREKKKGFTNILKAHCKIIDSTLKTRILAGQESFKIHPLIDANAWAVLPAEREIVNNDELVDLYPSSFTFETLF